MKSVLSFKKGKKLFQLIITLLMLTSNVVFAIDKNYSMYGDKTIKDFEDKTYGIKTGSMIIDGLEATYKNPKVKYYNNNADILQDLERGVIDATAFETINFFDIYQANHNFKMSKETLIEEHIAFAISNNIIENNNQFYQDLNEFIRESKGNGYIKCLEDKWLCKDLTNVEYENKTFENAKCDINVVYSISPPLAYLKGDEVKGFDIELLEEFATKYGYALHYELADLASLLMGISTGKYDVGASGVCVTDERKKNMNFSDVYRIEIIAPVYYQMENKLSLIDNIKESFENSFIVDNRYKYFVSGLLMTIFIMLSSVFIGTICGVILYLVYRKGNTFVKQIINLYSFIIHGIPFLVLILVLYYVVFGKLNISSSIVAIIAFVIAFSLFVANGLRSAVDNLDYGQIESAYALGLSDSQTFWTILMPQAVINMFSSYKSQIIDLLKNTSIVGYIAVFDLTRAGDVVRARTYQALFPILSVAFIYFIMGIVITFILNKVEALINPYNKNMKFLERKLRRG